MLGSQPTALQRGTAGVLEELRHGAGGRQLGHIQIIRGLGPPCYMATDHISSVTTAQAAPGLPCLGAPGYQGFMRAVAIP